MVVGNTSDFSSRESPVKLHDALELVLSDSLRQFVFYSFISSGQLLQCPDSDTITLFTAEGDIFIYGSNLEPVYRAIMARKLPRVSAGKGIEFTIGTTKSVSQIRSISFGQVQQSDSTESDLIAFDQPPQV